jgi:hypothetical protein
MENIMINILTIDETLNIILIVFISFLGSVSKDYLKVLNNPIKKFNIMEVFLSTVTASITIYSFSDFIIEYIGIKGLVFSSFLVGLIGFELLTQLSTLKGVFKWIDIIIKITRHEYILKEDADGISDDKEEKKEDSS